MRTSRRVACAGYALAVAGVLSGCRSSGTDSQFAPIAQQQQLRAVQPVSAPRSTLAPLPKPNPPTTTLVGNPAAVARTSETRPASFTETARLEEIQSPELVSPRPQAGTLDIHWLVSAVLQRNPDIQSAVAAWQAAAQRYPQEVSLDDPMLGLMLGPGSWGSNQVRSAYGVQASQKLPWAGKRQLRGDIARAQANAAYYETGEQRLLIAETTRVAYYQYYLAFRQLEVLAASTELLQSFHEIAQKRYEAGQVEQQDVLLAEVELGELERRQLELNRREQVARARLNTLLLVTPDSPLPPPAKGLNVESALPQVDQLRQQALTQRPELAAQAARIRAERYSIELAQKEFMPDTEFFGRYDAFWQEDQLRPMVGMNLNMPVYKAKRWAALREAGARLAKQQAELESQINEIAFEVEQAYRRVEESRQSLDVYEQRILPRAEHSVESARASYVAGRLDFLRLIESQRQLLELQDQYYATVAHYHERLAQLVRVIASDRILSTDEQ